MSTLSEILIKRQRQNFVDRVNEVLLFKSLLELSSPEYHILAIRGVGGIGKSALLEEFRAICDTMKIPAITINMADQKSILDYFRVFHDYLKIYIHEFSSIREFAEDLKHLSNIITNLEIADQKHLDNKQKIILRTSLSALKAFVPFTAPLLEGFDAENKAEQAVLGFLRKNLSEKDINFFFSAENLLTDKLVSIINEISRTKRRLVVMFDTYEVAGSLDIWVREKFASNLDESVTIVIAGRERLSDKWNKWQPLIAEIELNSFSVDATKQYLLKRGIEEDKLIQELFQFTQGHPLCLAISADIKARRPKFISMTVPEKLYIIDTLIDRILAQIPEAGMRKLLRACATLRYFNKDILKILVGARMTNNHYNQLRKMSFIYARTGGLAIHDIVRDYLRADMQEHSPEEYIKFNERAVTWYEQRIAVTKGEKQERNSLELLYHKLSLDEDHGMLLFRTLFENAARLFHVAYCSALLQEVAAQALRIDNQYWVKYYEGRLAFRKGNWQETESIYRNLLKKEDLDIYLSMDVATRLASMYRRQAKLGLAESMLSDILIRCRKLAAGSADYNLRIAETSFELGKVYRSLGKLDQSVLSYNTALETFKTQKDENKVAECLLHLGAMHNLKGDWQIAIDLIDQSSQIYKRVKNEYGISRILFNLGWTYIQAGKWDEAMELLQQALTMSRNYNARHSIVGTLVVLGRLYLHMEMIPKAIECFQESQILSKELEYYVFRGMLLRFFGIAFLAKDELSKAEEYFEESLADEKKSENKLGIAQCMFELGKLHVRQNAQIAQGHFTEAIRICDGIGAWFDKACSLVGLCEALVKLNASELFLTNYDFAHKVSNEHHYTRLLSELHCIRARFEIIRNNASGGCEHYNESISQALNYNLTFTRNITEIIVRELQDIKSINFPCAQYCAELLLVPINRHSMPEQITSPFLTALREIGKSKSTNEN